MKFRLPIYQGKERLNHKDPGDHPPTNKMPRPGFIPKAAKKDFFPLNIFMKTWKRMPTVPRSPAQRWMSDIK